jgi:hypothetical protein
VDDATALFQELLIDARADPDVLAVYVVGSRAERDELQDERFGYDVGVVISERPGA